MPWARGAKPSVDDTTAMLRRWRGEFDLGQDYVYGIFSADEKLVLGGTGLHTRRGPDVREIGYWIHVDHVNRGYATETAAALTRVAFEVDAVRRVEIHCVPSNVRSASVPRKLGFSYEATLRERLQSGEDTWEDDMIWSLFADAYAGSPAAGAMTKAYAVNGRALLSQ
jgi:RimJ/RimL family protein N-acetyltransferase